MNRFRTSCPYFSANSSDKEIIVMNYSTSRTVLRFDTLTMAKRCLMLSRRNPDALLSSILMPILMMLLFTALFGKLIRTDGIPYVDYIVPGILLQCFAQCSAITAITVNRDLTSGMVSRFCTLPIRKSSILNGHILEAAVRNLISSAAVLAAAFVLGFRPSAGPAGWCVVLLLLAGVILAFSWLSVLTGLLTRSPEGAGGLFTFALVLPYLSSGFVPTESMPAALAIFAHHQPMTPVIDSIRAILLGNFPETGTLMAALLWCVGLSALFCFAAVRCFHRKTSDSQK